MLNDANPAQTLLGITGILYTKRTSHSPVSHTTSRLSPTHTLLPRDPMAGREESTTPRSIETMELNWYGTMHAERMQAVYARSGLDFPSRNEKLRAQRLEARREHESQARRRMARALDELSESTSYDDLASTRSESLPKSLLAPEIAFSAPDGRDWTPKQKEEFRNAARKEATDAAQEIWGDKIDLDEFNDRMTYRRLRSGELYDLPESARKADKLYDISQNVALDKDGPQHLNLAEHKERERRRKRREEQARLNAKNWFEASISGKGRRGEGLEPPSFKQKPVDQCFVSGGGEVSCRADSDLSLLPNRKDYALDEAGKAMFLRQPGKRTPPRKRKAARDDDESEEDEDECLRKKLKARKAAIEAYHAPVATTLLEYQRQMRRASTPPSPGASAPMASSSTVVVSRDE
ncbi:hypothetical protein CERZMDRAFT_88736 [Cercospora zeae-maydis SCOH1-5]|uniref:Uncharacterized protein n=1 Tax=Cercospora zeae-maydis SCOH1-5 TaxID=717836 RepID=A0A6A6F482_9PEZI|nr:hypothetical protein CERZMDRAFT_88736 [Cercospora zeae-maydis SCOH1-5]